MHVTMLYFRLDSANVRVDDITTLTGTEHRIWASLCLESIRDDCTVQLSLIATRFEYFALSTDW